MSQLKIRNPNDNSWYTIPEGGVGVPSGGTAGQVLTKSSGTDYATEWALPLSIKLLWTNPSPANNFAAQTVQLDLSGYDFILLKIGGGTKVIPIDGDVREYCFQPYGGAQIGYRSVYATTAGVVFDDFYHVATYGGFSSRTKDNALAIPFNIYGIKGVG